MTADELPGSALANLPRRWLASISAPTASTYLPLALLGLALLVFKVTHRLLYEVGHYGSDVLAFGVVGFTCVAACLFAMVRYASIPWLLRVVVRGIGAFILVQVLFDSFGAVAPPP